MEIPQCASIWWIRRVPVRRPKLYHLDAFIYCSDLVTRHDPPYWLPVSFCSVIKASVEKLLVSFGCHDPSVTIASVPFLSTYDIHFLYFFPDISVNIHSFWSLLRRSYRVSSNFPICRHGVHPSKITLPSVFLYTFDSVKFSPISNFLSSHLIYSPPNQFSLPMILVYAVIPLSSLWYIWSCLGTKTSPNVFMFSFPNFPGFCGGRLISSWWI